jgi:hypothetical protein
VGIIPYFWKKAKEFEINVREMSFSAEGKKTGDIV